ncbi:MAG TPA: hypothetical protein VK151_09665 [Fluviicola sp.]|nr:hypothetical protein [Fluviicola sp.]
MIKQFLNLLFCVAVFNVNAQFASLSSDIRYVHRDVFDLSCMMQAGTAKGNKIWFDEHCKPEFQNKEGIWRELPELWETYSLYSKDKAIETINQLDKARFSEEERIWAKWQLYLIDKDIAKSDIEANRLRKLNPESYLLLFSEVNSYLSSRLWDLNEEKSLALLERVEAAMKKGTLPVNQQVFLQLAQYDLKAQLGRELEKKEALLARLWNEHPGILIPGLVENRLSDERKEYASVLHQINLTTEKNLSIKTLKLLRSPLLDYANPVELKQLLNQSTPKEQLLIKTLAIFHTGDYGEYTLIESLGEWGNKLLFPNGPEKRRFSEAFRKELLVTQTLDEWNTLLGEVTGTSKKITEEESKELVQRTPKGMSPNEAIQLSYGMAFYYYTASQAFSETMGFLFLQQGKQKSPTAENLESIDAFMEMLRANPYFDLQEEMAFVHLSLQMTEEGRTLFFSNPDELITAIEKYHQMEKEYPASPIVKTNLLALISTCIQLDSGYCTEPVIRAYVQTQFNLMCMGMHYVEEDNLRHPWNDKLVMLAYSADDDCAFEYFSKTEIREFIARLKTIDPESTNGYLATEVIDYLKAHL